MKYKGYVFDVYPGVYKPCDDSFLLADNLVVRRGERVLDMGTGCGIQGIIAAGMGASVLACDILPRAVRCARHNARSNGVDMEVVKSDLFQKVSGSFDLITFNPPYLPPDPLEKEVRRAVPGMRDVEAVAWDGGRDGRRVITRFLRGCREHLNPGGRVLLVASSLTGIDNVLREFLEAGLRARVVAKKRFFFEEIVVFEGRF